LITFNRISYKNFLSAGNVPIVILLDTHGLTLITGKNGVGKSQLIEAITFALYGKPYRNFNKPQLLNSINLKQLLVELDFEVGSKTYKVVRGIKPNVFEIYEDGKLLNQDPSVRDYQKVLEQQIVKMNYRAFTQVVIMGSSAYTPFMRLKAADRREFIEDLLDIRIFSVMNTLLKDMVKLLKEQIRDVDAEIKSLREKAELQQAHIKSRQKEKQNVVTLLGEEIENLLKENEEHQTCVVQFMSTIADLNNESVIYENAPEKLTELRTLRKRIEGSIKKYHDEKELFHNIDECPVCRQTVHDSHRDCILGSVDTKIEELETDLHELQTQFDSVNQDLVKFEEYSVKINDLNKEVSRCNKLILVNNAMVESKKVQIESINTDTTSIDEETKRLKEYAKAIVKKSDLKKELLETQQYQTTATVLLQDNGIKAKIVKQYIPVINKLINRYLDSLDFFVGFHLDENFNEVIKSRHRDTFSYESFSDGQKRRIDAALLLTWRDVAKSKNSINTNVVFFDEFDAPMDGQGSDMLLELYKASNISNVFVISHKEGLVMKEYQFLVTVYEGSDEWWEELNEMEIEPRLEAIGGWIEEFLNDNCIECKVKNKNYYQLELPL